MRRSDLVNGLKAVLAVAGALAVGLLMFQPGHAEREAVSIRIPAETLQRVGGGTFDLASLGGKPYLLEVWEYSCPYCLQEIPALNELHRSGRLQVVSLIYEPAGQEVGEGELRELGIEYPVYRARGGLLGKLGLVAFPTAYLVNSSGEAVESIVGTKDNSLLRRMAERFRETEKKK